jgi:hypothetical protein
MFPTPLRKMFSQSHISETLRINNFILMTSTYACTFALIPCSAKCFHLCFLLKIRRTCSRFSVRMNCCVTFLTQYFSIINSVTAISINMVYFKSCCACATCHFVLLSYDKFYTHLPNVSPKESYGPKGVLWIT